ncbi:MAG: type II toxin-antitoxin system prevent-host-death family antitoxin [Patescibacteria group bacterium]
MNTIRVSATHARNNFFDLLNQVALGAKVTVVRDAKEVAEIIPKATKTDWKGLMKAMNAAHGILKDYDPTDSPLRNPKLMKNWGKWDRSVKHKP